MKIIFMGTPDFAVKILEKIHEKHEIILVITQPDTYNYRKKSFSESPVKQYALRENLLVHQPIKIKDEIDYILNLSVDLIITAAYGQFIPIKILNHPKYSSINVHGSLLPKYRGGAPIQRAIINGEVETGISIIYMGKKMDAGEVIMMRRIPIFSSDNQDTMFEKLSILGSKMILEVIEGIKDNKITATPQNEKDVSFAYNLTKEDERIDFSKDSISVFNQIRGLNSNPGAYFELDGQNIKVYNSKVSVKSTNFQPGIIVGVSKDSFEISCGGGSVISITEIQMPSKKKINVNDFLNGNGKNIIVKNKEVNL